MKKIISHSEAETFSLGANLASQLKDGEILALYGDLGAGKTRFLQGLAKGLGVKGRVNSPTFNILKLYRVGSQKAIKTFCHIDAYRLDSGRDLETLGISEIFEDQGIVTAIEWAEKVEDILPPAVRRLYIKRLDEEKREIIIR